MQLQHTLMLQENKVYLFCQFAKYFATKWHFSLEEGFYSVLSMAKLNIWELSSCSSSKKGLLKLLKDQDSGCVNSLEVIQTCSYFFPGKCPNHSAEPMSSLTLCWSWTTAATAIDTGVLGREVSWTFSTA